MVHLIKHISDILLRIDAGKCDFAVFHGLLEITQKAPASSEVPLAIPRQLLYLLLQESVRHGLRPKLVYHLFVRLDVQEFAKQQFDVIFELLGNPCASQNSKRAFNIQLYCVCPLDFIIKLRHHQVVVQDVVQEG